MNKETLKGVLRKHRAWLDGEEGGERAYLCDVYLRRANLSRANLRVANLCDADLCGANLCGANLCDANLRRANLSRANLRVANLCDADLCGANLCDANLCGARGNGIEVKSLHALKWDVVWTDKVLAIGCMQYDIEEWLSLTDEQIAEMDPEALDFMNENRDLILKLIGRDDPRWIDRERKEEKAREVKEGERDTARERGEAS